MRDIASFYRGKRVFITGHTGFKGRWLVKWLLLMGAEVTGYSLPPTGEGAILFDFLSLDGGMRSVFGDIRDFGLLKDTFEEVKPEIVFHLAAQPLVLESYEDPLGTYSTNVMGTVHILECIRNLTETKSFLNVTTDKVYENRECDYGYKEEDKLDGFDPYSNSKSCSELVTHSYRRSFFSNSDCAISTARAGNVIGGGDFAANRIVPDCLRAVYDGKIIKVRNPLSVRPYQHVLESLYAYLLIAMAQYEDKTYAGCYNVGPEENDCITTGALVTLFCEYWGKGACWQNISIAGNHEANILQLDCAKIKRVLGWYPQWNIRDAIEKTVDWGKAWQCRKDITALMDEQIAEYMRERREEM